MSRVGHSKLRTPCEIFFRRKRRFLWCGLTDKPNLFALDNHLINEGLEVSLPERDSPGDAFSRIMRPSSSIAAGGMSAAGHRGSNTGSTCIPPSSTTHSPAVSQATFNASFSFGLTRRYSYAWRHIRHHQLRFRLDLVFPAISRGTQETVCLCQPHLLLDFCAPRFD